MSILIKSPIINGDGNSFVISESNGSNVYWDRLEEECLKTLQKLPSYSAENRAVKEVFADSIQHNEANLKSTVKKHAKVLSSGLFTSAAGTFLAEFIKNILHM